jgi:hypothetical protein
MKEAWRTASIEENESKIFGLFHLLFAQELLDVLIWRHRKHIRDFPQRIAVAGFQQNRHELVEVLAERRDQPQPLILAIRGKWPYFPNGRISQPLM